MYHASQAIRTFSRKLIHNTVQSCQTVYKPTQEALAEGCGKQQ